MVPTFDLTLNCVRLLDLPVERIQQLCRGIFVEDLELGSDQPAVTDRPRGRIPESGLPGHPFGL